MLQLSNITKIRLLNAFKTMLAVLIGYLVGLTLQYLKLAPMGQWVIITILVVMAAQPNLGGALKKSTMRFVGSILGVIIALTCLALFNNNELANLIVLLLSTLVFVYFASSQSESSYAGVIGSITVAIVLLHDGASIHYGFSRGVEIIMGIIIAVIVTRYIFPIRAEHRLYNVIATCLQDFIDLINLRCDEVIISNNPPPDKFLANFTKQLTFIREASAENKHCDVIVFRKLNSNLRQLYRATGMLFDFLDTHFALREKMMANKHFINYIALLKQDLNHLADAFNQKIALPEQQLNTTQHLLHKAMNELLTEINHKRENHIIAFCAEMIESKIANINQLKQVLLRGR